MEDLLTRVVENLIGRVSGPMKFRLLIQPLMAAVFAVRDGLKDAREERPPFFRAIFTHPDQRSDMLKDGWKSVGKIFVIAIIIDLVEQFICLSVVLSRRGAPCCLYSRFHPVSVDPGPCEQDSAGQTAQRIRRQKDCEEQVTQT